MTTDTANKIIEYIAEHKAVTPHQLQTFLGIGAPALFRQLKKLRQTGQVKKVGSAPKVFYSLSDSDSPTGSKIVFDPKLAKFIQENWMSVSPLGEIHEGIAGFEAWCLNVKLPVTKTAHEYWQTYTKYGKYKRAGLVDGLPKIKGTFSHVYLDKLYYLDFYSIERFGKTKLGALLLYAKQSQSRELMSRLFESIHLKIEAVARKYKIEAVGFIPPTIQRTIQLQKELEKSLALTVPRLKIVKATGTVTVAQKTLTKLVDRIDNAAGSIFVEDIPPVKRILLIDDAVGSGASLNETARKIKEKRKDVVVIGLAITGSLKGFDVLNEV